MVRAVLMSVLHKGRAYFKPWPSSVQLAMAARGCRAAQGGRARGLGRGVPVVSAPALIGPAPHRGKSCRTITFEQFQEALEELAKKRFKDKSSEEAVREVHRLIEGRAPVISGVTVSGQGLEWEGPGVPTVPVLGWPLVAVRGMQPADTRQFGEGCQGRWTHPDPAPLSRRPVAVLNASLPHSQ